MKVFIEQTDERLFSGWATIIWRAVEKKRQTTTRTDLPRHRAAGVAAGQKPAKTPGAFHIEHQGGSDAPHNRQALHAHCHHQLHQPMGLSLLMA